MPIHDGSMQSSGVELSAVLAEAGAERGALELLVVVAERVIAKRESRRRIKQIKQRFK